MKHENETEISRSEIEDLINKDINLIIKSDSNLNVVKSLKTTYFTGYEKMFNFYIEKNKIRQEIDEDGNEHFFTTI
jgi:hypothetical protein